MRRLLNRYKITNEAKQVGDIYHVCTLKAYLKYIMPNDTLQSSGKYINYLYGGTNYVSFTRDKYFVVGTDTVEMSSVLIQLVIDGNKLSERYKIGPYNDFTYDTETGEFDPTEDNFKHREKEEVVRGPIKNISRYIKEIRIDSRRSVGGTEAVLLEKNKNKLKNCVYYNFIKNSTHLKALDVLKNGDSFNEFLNIIKICVDPKSFAYKVKSGDINDIINAVDAGYDINAPAINGDTLLSYYAGLNKKDIIKRLFKLGADPNAENMDGSIALDNAVLYNNYDIAKILLDNGAEIRDSTIDLVASDEMKELLAKYDNSIDLNENYNRLEKRIAFLESKADQEMLRKYLGDDYYNKYQLIKNKINDPDYKDIYKLIKKDPDEVKDYIDNFQSNRDSIKAAKEGATKLYEDQDWVVYKITSYNAAKYYGKNTRWCISGNYPGHEGLGEKYFNDYIRDYNLDGYYFYINKHNRREKYAVLKDRNTGEVSSIWDSSDEDLGRSLLDADIDLPYVEEIGLKMYNKEDLFDAIKMCEDDVEIMENYVDDSTINATDSKGYTPLIMAVNRRFMNVAKYLIKRGADVNARDNDGISSLAYACLKDDYDMAKLLIDNGADVNVKTKYGTLLQCTDDNRIKRLLIDHSSKIN